MIINNRNHINSNVIKNYIQHHNNSVFNSNNYDINKNMYPNLEQKYLNILNKQNREAFNHKNKINIYEENSKFINANKIFKFKNAQISPEQNTFNKDISKDKKTNLSKINTNIFRNSHIMKMLKQYKKNNLTINEKELFNQKEKFNALLNIKNKVNKDEKYKI